MDSEIAFWNWTSISGAVEDSIRELDTASNSDTEELVTPVWSVNMAVIVLSCITLISLILLCVLNRYSHSCVKEGAKQRRIVDVAVIVGNRTSRLHNPSNSKIRPVMGHNDDSHMTCTGLSGH